MSMRLLTLLSATILVQNVDGFSTGMRRPGFTFGTDVRQQTKPQMKQSSDKRCSSQVLDLMREVSRVQSPKSRKKVEAAIAELGELANARPAAYKKPVTPGAYRTAWSTVTSDTLFGQILRQTPSTVLGGPSWQVISSDRTKSENVVYWPNLGLRMAGLASLSPIAQNAPKKRVGYELTIKGLEFRWGSTENDGLPEQLGLLGAQQSNDRQSVWEVVKLKDDEVLSNGLGELEVLYNDGLVRIVRDSLQDNTYIHVREPVPISLEAFL